MTDIEIRPMLGRIRATLIERGFAELVGGVDVLDAGLRDLEVGALLIAAELTAADRAGVGLDEAVFDQERFPHVTRLHGFVRDIVRVEVPGEIIPWARAVSAMGPAPDAPEFRGAFTQLALRSGDPMRRGFAAFALFEMLCLTQRLDLLADGTRLEPTGGRERDIEVIAAHELEIAMKTALGDDVLAADEPMDLLAKSALVALWDHQAILKDELQTIAKDFLPVMERRQRILEVMEAVSPTDAVLIFNETADEFGEERLSAAQLRREHPALLEHLSDDGIYKRVERLPMRVANDVRVAKFTFGDLLLETAGKEEKG